MLEERSYKKFSNCTFNSSITMKFVECEFKGVVFRNMFLERSIFVGVKFDDCSFEGVNGVKCNFIDCSFNEVEISEKSNFGECVFKNCVVKNTTVLSSIFSGGKFSGGTFSNIYFYDVNLSSVCFTETVFDEFELCGCNFSSGEISHTVAKFFNVSNSNLYCFTFMNTVFHDIIFMETVNLSLAKFSYCSFYGDTIFDVSPSLYITSNFTIFPVKGNLFLNPVGLKEIVVLEKNLDNAVFDIATLEFVERKRGREEDEDVIFFVILKDEKPYPVLSWRKSYITNSIKNKEFLYECGGKLFENGDKSMENFGDTPYLKLALTSFFYVSLAEIKSVLLSKEKYFYLIPENREISHTISYKIAYSNNPVYVGSYHCQKGSNISVYNIFTGKGKKRKRGEN